MKGNNEKQELSIIQVEMDDDRIRRVVSDGENSVSLLWKGEQKAVIIVVPQVFSFELDEKDDYIFVNNAYLGDSKLEVVESQLQKLSIPEGSEADKKKAELVLMVVVDDLVNDLKSILSKIEMFSEKDSLDEWMKDDEWVQGDQAAGLKQGINLLKSLLEKFKGLPVETNLSQNLQEVFEQLEALLESLSAGTIGENVEMFKNRIFKVVEVEMGPYYEREYPVTK